MADITLSNFELEVIEASRRQPGAAGHLGALVRPLQDARADAGEAGDGLRRPLRAGQARRRPAARDRRAAHACSACAASPCACCSRTASRWTASSARCRRASCAPSSTSMCRAQDAVAGQDDAERAREMLAAGHVDDGIAALKHALELDPANDGARCACPARADPRRATRRGARRSMRRWRAAVRRRPTTLAAAGLWLKPANKAPRPTSQPRPRRRSSAFAAPRTLAAARFTEALDELLEILMRDKNWGEGRARTTYLAILRLMRYTRRPRPSRKAPRRARHRAGGRDGRAPRQRRRHLPPAPVDDPVLSGVQTTVCASSPRA